MDEKDAASVSATVSRNGPYRVAGSLPLSRQVIEFGSG